MVIFRPGIINNMALQEFTQSLTGFFPIKHGWIYFLLMKLAFKMKENLTIHTPAIIYVYTDNGKGWRPFKYFTMWRMSPQFEECIRRVWSIEVQVTKMFRLVKKLKNVKSALKELNREGLIEIQAAELQAYHILQAA